MGPSAKECTQCGEKASFRGDVCRPCRRRLLTDESDFTENTVRTALLLGNGWMVSNTWRFIYILSGVGAVWLGRDIAKHTEYMVLPMLLLVFSMGNETVQKRTTYIPRSFKRISAATLRLGLHAQMVAFMLVMGIGAGHAAAHWGLDPYLRNPLNLMADAEKVRGQDAADSFPSQIPMLQKQLAIVDGLIDKSNLAEADARMRDIDGALEPVLKSYARSFADVVAVQKQALAMHERINTRRQTLELNTAMSRVDQVSKRLDQIDHELSRSRWDLASHLWVKVQRDVEELSNPAAALTQQIATTTARLEKQRDMIRRGFQHLPMPADSSVAKQDAPTKKKRHATSSHAVASVD